MLRLLSLLEKLSNTGDRCEAGCISLFAGPPTMVTYFSFIPLTRPAPSAKSMS